MKAREYIETHGVFTIGEFYEAVGKSQSSLNYLHRAKRAGRLASPTRGVYVSKTGRYAGDTPTSYAVASKLANDSVLCCLSAIGYNIGNHNIVFRATYYSRSRIARIVFEGIEYIRYPYPQQTPLLTTKRLPDGTSFNVTTKEQTIVDALRWPGRCGGIEAILRSLSVVEYVDTGILLSLADQTAVLSAQVGWLLEAKQAEWRVPDAALETLEARTGAGPHRWPGTTGNDKDKHFSHRWRLYLPEEEQTMREWLNE